jgi:hypothetical protein
VPRPPGPSELPARHTPGLPRRDLAQNVLHHRL